MLAIWILFRWELLSFFYHPLLYVIGFLVSGMNAFILLYVQQYLARTGQVSADTLIPLLLGDSFLFWILIIVLCPLLTMRLLSEERSLGTMELLLTSPVRDEVIVLSKFLSALFCFVVVWLPTFFLLFFLMAYSNLGWERVLCSFCGFLGVSSLFISVGLWASSLTSHQVFSAVIGFFVSLIILVFFPILFQSFPLVEYYSPMFRMSQFVSGMFSLQSCVYFVSLTLFFLFFTRRVLAVRHLEK